MMHHDIRRRLRVKEASGRKLHFERLEQRICLTFCYVGVVNGWHTWNGEAGDDTLDAIWGSGGTIWWKSGGTEWTPPCLEYGNWENGPLFNTGTPIPAATTPIAIKINGYAGRDVVTFWAGPAAPPLGPSGNMAGFPPSSVSTLVFMGGDGADDFFPPEGAGPTAPGPVAYPAPGDPPNIGFWGEGDNDTLNNYNDPEYFDGGDGDDFAPVGFGKGGGNDVLQGGADVDTLSGGPDNDLIEGGTENDQLHGDDGEDSIIGNEGVDMIYGGNHDDFLVTGSSVGGVGIEYVEGNDGDDRIRGDLATDETHLNGNGHNDVIIGSDYNDTISGGDGLDHVEGRGGNDLINGGDNIDVLWSGGVDQPWRTNGQGNPAWFNMDPSGPDDDGYCDIEDSNFDLDGMACMSNAIVANDDDFSVSHAGVLSVLAPGILWNDTYGNPPPWIEILHNPMFGALTVNVDGGFTYDPNDNFVGTDKFTYRLSDGITTSAWPAVVYLHVNNIAPQANNDNANMVWNASGNNSITFNVITNPSGNGTDTDADGDDIDILEIVPGSGPQKGTLSVNYETGAVTYTYTGPNPGMMPTSDSFQYKAKDDWAESVNTATVSIFITGTPLLLDRPAIDNPSPDTPSVTDSDLALLAEEAARRWVAAGADPSGVRDVLSETTFVIADLIGSTLGMELPGTIVIDVNAAGYGWFVDASPASDDEFSILVSPSERQAASGSGAYGRVDLLTVIMHEFGHALGMEHLEGDEFAHSVMNDTLGLSMRRVPTAADILAADEYFASLWEAGSTLKRRRW